MMKFYKINPDYRLVLLGMLFLLMGGCKKSTSEDKEVDLLTNATEYTGTFPVPGMVTYLNNGVTAVVKAYPGQVIAFFNLSVSEADASQVITAKGGTILAKIPAVGYYFIGIDSTQESSFIATLQSNSFVNMIEPNVASGMKSGVALLDNCGFYHEEKVLQTLEKCGGVYDKCIKIQNGIYASASGIIYGIINEANRNKGGTTLINLSYNGGLDSDVDFEKQPLKIQLEGLASWFDAMYYVLNAVSFLPPQYRQNLIITIAAGNENMHIDGLLEQLRQRKGITEVLNKNVILVSTEENNGFGNYALSDPDVVVMNNPDAAAGTSLAAPCVMGLIDSLMIANRVTAADAIKAVKIASLLNPNRYVIPSEVGAILEIVSGRTEYTGGSKLLTFQITNQQCVGLLSFTSLPDIFWNGIQGSMLIPTSCIVTLVSGDNCFVVGSPADSETFQFNLTGSNTNISGQGTILFNIGQGGVSVTAAFTGAINVSGDISGTLKLTPVGIGTQSVSVTLFKQ